MGGIGLREMVGFLRQFGDEWTRPTQKNHLEKFFLYCPPPIPLQTPGFFGVSAIPPIQIAPPFTKIAMGVCRHLAPDCVVRTGLP